MEFERWEPVYESILEDLGLERNDDENSVRILKAVTLGSLSIPVTMLRNFSEGRSLSSGTPPASRAISERRGWPARCSVRGRP